MINTDGFSAMVNYYMNILLPVGEISSLLFFR